MDQNASGVTQCSRVIECDSPAQNLETEVEESTPSPLESVAPTIVPTEEA